MRWSADSAGLVQSNGAEYDIGWRRGKGPGDRPGQPYGVIPQ